MDQITSSLRKLQHYIESNNYEGFDPYDALKSPFFKLPILRSNKIIRFGTQQLVKRFPVNMRKLLFVPKGLNPVTLGLCIQAYSYLSEVFPDLKEEYLCKIDNLIAELENLISPGYSGSCWGYDFDWEARYAPIPAYQPTIVATGFIVNSLFECYKITGNEKAKELIINTRDFILKDINRSYANNGTFCFSYSPFDKQIVYNASMKGVRILSFIYCFTNDTELKRIAHKAIDYVIDSQNDDGSWYYAKRSSGEWVDNYHSGYILDCMNDFINYFNPTDIKYIKVLELGLEYYVNNFFEDNRIPKFYDIKIYPIDCTSAAQSILTLTKFGKQNLAWNIAKYMIDNMQNKEGYFYFRKFKYYQIKTSFMRWSNAWMYASLTFLLYKLNETK